MLLNTGPWRYTPTGNYVWRKNYKPMQHRDVQKWVSNLWRIFRNTDSFYGRRVQQPGVCSFCWNFDSFQVNSQKLGSSGATECGVWIGKCNVKVWKSTKLHKIWRSVKFHQNEHPPVFYVKLWHFFLPREVDFWPCFTSFACVCNFSDRRVSIKLFLRQPASSETREIAPCELKKSLLDILWARNKCVQ